ncbi:MULTISPECIES: NAD-dependent epimerase/dehydratase family protein [unclassified Acinetobacter]|uniref:NAD-dependent epimerase/dehydratase family protein n=1 Tax=unclassified Acinetobacter TaxID=196816 RepID=UPI0035BA5340
MANLKTAIVTGATGGLGRNLTEKLLQDGWRVIACGRNQTIGKQLNTTFHAFDLADKHSVLQHFSSADVVFHCAALSSPWGHFDDFYQANVLATENVIHAVRKYNIGKLIHVSTPSIYFDFHDHLQVKEDFVAKNFANDYAYSKFLAEQVVQNAYDIDSVIIRPRGIFGAYDTAVLPRLLKLAEKGFLPLIQRHGRQAGDALVDVTYVENVVYALLLATEHDVPRAMKFNISNDEPYTVKQLYEKICQTLSLNVKFKNLPYTVIDQVAKAMEFQAKLFNQGKKEPLITRYSAGTIAFDQTLDIQRARQYLGYQPLFNINTGLQRYAEWLAENKIKY